MTLFSPAFRLACLLACLAPSGALLADTGLPAALLRIPESTNTLFFAETASNQFHRFDRDGDSVVHSGSYYMSIGRNGAGKLRSGDRKTPLGVYFVTEQLDTSRMHEKYGITAFPLDYPNAWDRLGGRDGYGIWIHGVLADGGQRPPRDTDGCIALPNEDLSLLVPAFNDNITPVVVTRKVKWVEESGNAAIAAELANRVETWVKAQEAGDLYAWLSLYSDDFERFGMNKSEWTALHVQGESLNAIERAEASELLLLAYPEEDGLYLSRFLVDISAAGATTQNYKRLYWRRGSDGDLKIVAENDG